MIYITLDDDQMRRVTTVAKQRRDRYAQIASNYGTTRELAKDLAGAAGELAVSIYTGLPWVGRYSDYNHDVGDLEVRTRRTIDGELCLHDLELERKKYKPGQRFVLCRYIVGTDVVELAGWSWVATILRKGRYIDGRTFLPNSDLYEMETVLL